MKRNPAALARIGLVGALAAVAVAALSACGSSGSSNAPTPTGTGAGTSAPTSTPATATALPAAPGAITVGSADFPENILLADIYADAMAAKGVRVSKHLDIGERATYMQAMADGSIGFIPEYSGSILAFLDPATTAKTPDDVWAALQPLAAAKNLVALRYAPAQDSDTITVTRATADKYQLTSIADLAPVAGKLTLGAPAQFQTRADGIPALASVYGVTFGRFTPTQAGGAITVTALRNGSIDAADIFATDPSIAANDFVTLTDPKSMFAAQNVVPLASAGKLTQPMADACDAVSAKLDTAALASLVAKVVVDKQDADAVAKAWLAQNGLG
ncbi:MAG: ABC transporter substrate-binding protein [Actinomycetia bacterium]|nr:ABC transporter substrate-binding protein [Actinomycetes bacterium]